jgi:hypothetical protein
MLAVQAKGSSVVTFDTKAGAFGSTSDELKLAKSKSSDKNRTWVV